MRERLQRLLQAVRTRFARLSPRDDFDEELADYISRAAERRIAAGMDEAQAMRLARAEVGSQAAVRENVRDVEWGSVLRTIWQDVRYGARLMQRSRRFTLVAALVLSVGIGVNTALFSIVNALFFTPLPVKSPDELVSLYRTIG